MGRPKSVGPTDHELLILKILWDDSPVGVSEILERFPKKPAPAYSSLLTIVRLMEQKGYIKHVKEGKAFLYSPILKQDIHKKSELKNIADKLFGGSRFDLAVNLLKEEKLSAAEVRKLKELLEGL